MAIEKGLVLAAIEVKLKGKSASKNFKENIAAKWAEKIETEADLNSFIEDREDVLLEACSEADRRATSAVAKAKEEAGKTTTTTTKEEEIKVDDDAPAWAKALLKQNETLSSKIEAFESSQKAKTITERFNSDPRIKDIPDFIRKGYVPATEDDFENNVEALTGEYKTFAEKNKLSTQGGDTPAGGANGGRAKDIKKLSPEEATAIVKQMNT